MAVAHEHECQGWRQASCKQCLFVCRGSPGSLASTLFLNHFGRNTTLYFET